MNDITRNVLAVVLGVLLGGAVNMGMVTLGPYLIPLPSGVDGTTMEGLQVGIKLYEAKHFLFPFLAHAMGTLVGAFVAAKLAANNHQKMAMLIAVVFLFGGISMVYMVGGPIWFIAVDLLLAYLPMGYIGGLLAGKKQD